MSRPTRHFPELSLYAFASGVYCECGFYVESDLIGDEPGHLATERVKDMWAEHINGQEQNNLGGIMTADHQWTDEPRFTNIQQIRDANTAAGKYWFSRNTVSAFKARVETRPYDEGISTRFPKGSRLWVESTTNYDDTAREYKVVRFDAATHDIFWARDTDGEYSYPSLEQAKSALLDLLATACHSEAQ